MTKGSKRASVKPTAQAKETFAGGYQKRKARKARKEELVPHAQGEGSAPGAQPISKKNSRLFKKTQKQMDAKLQDAREIARDENGRAVRRCQRCNKKGGKLRKSTISALVGIDPRLGQRPMFLCSGCSNARAALAGSLSFALAARERKVVEAFNGSGSAGSSSGSDGSEGRLGVRGRRGWRKG